MPRRARHRLRRPRAGVLALLVASTLSVLASVACRRAPDDAPPVATPSLALSRSEAPVGSPLDLTFRFVVAPSAPAFDQDYWVFVHFLDEDGELLWTEDHAPSTPTREWTPGRVIEYARTVFIPRFPDEGQVSIELGLFSPSTGNRLPLAGETRGMRSYKVAALSVLLETPVPIAFGTGWHDVEVSDDAIGVEWQWTRKVATLSFPNPERDVELFLQVDQPVALTAPQQVQVLLGSTVIDTFPLPQGTPLIRRLPLVAAQLGGGETVTVSLVVDTTFVPASMAALRNPDRRELGIRVFRAFVRPA